MLALIQAHPSLAWSLLASTAIGLLAAIAAAIVIIRLPPDFFSKPRAPARGPWRIARNIAGWILIVAGIAMIPLPGPGSIFILLGVMLADFPGKAKVQRWLLSRGPILKPANYLRARFHQPPLTAPTPRSAPAPNAAATA